jgi:bifunctional UDP-N-acetylglucosamine pyrophosphorylase / glucosamine-1-phosphate N-acetyltransferase
MSQALAAIILAAGKGTRMRSALPKVLHRILGRPLVLFPVRLAEEQGADPVVVVVGHGAAEVKNVLPASARIAVQHEQRGTADAVRVGLDALADYDGQVMILSGDVPLLTRHTLSRLLAQPGEVALVTARTAHPDGYGRVVRGSDGRIARIVEERDASIAERGLREVNAGIYRFEASFLRSNLGALTATNSQRELYLTDLIARAAAQVGVGSVDAELTEVAGINDRHELSVAEAVCRAQLNARHQRDGVTLIDPTATYIELDVELGKDVTIEPGCLLMGRSTIADGVTLRAYSVVEDATVGPGCVVGPFARLRPKAELSADVHIGNFVEVKNARLGKGTKANHLAYLGDAEIGEHVNVGAGTITCNYDGQRKSVTRIGDGVFIGSDSQLVAPVSVGAGAYVGAGSTIQQDVPEDSLVFTRAPLVVKRDWAKAKREKAKP